MALARIKTWNPGDTLTAADLNAEFNNPLNNALSLISPLSGTLAFSGTSPFSVANAQTLTVSIAAQTVGAATLTIPNFASVADTLAFVTLAQTLSNKTLSAPTFSGAYTLGGTPTFGATMAGASTFSGAITLSAAGTALTVTNNTQIGSLGIGVAPSGTAGRLTINESFILPTAGRIAWQTSVDVGPSIYGDVANLRFRGGTSVTIWASQANVENMRLTDGGIFAVGTAITAGAGSGQIVLVNNTSAVRAVNAAGTSTFPLIGAAAGDAVAIANAGGDILWGRALIALGAGATATLGAIGGAGPATAGQNTWMRILDSTGAAFWVPAWK